MVTLNNITLYSPTFIRLSWLVKVNCQRGGLEGSITWKTYLHWKQHPDQDRGGSLWFGLSQRYTLFLQIWFHSSLFSWIFVQTTDSASSRFWKMGFVKKNKKHKNALRSLREQGNFENKFSLGTDFLVWTSGWFPLAINFSKGNLFKYAFCGRNLKTELRLNKK